MKKDCPSQRAYIATDDGGYISTSDEENKVDNTELHNDQDHDDGTTFGAKETMSYRAIIVQRVLST